MRWVVVALLAIAAIFVAVPLFIAGVSARNGHYTCDSTMPASLGSTERVVQNKHRVLLFPLALECSYTTVERPTESDYTVVTTDLGTGWWAVASVSLLSAVAVWAVAPKRTSSGPARTSR